MRESNPLRQVLLTAESSGCGGTEHTLLDDIRVRVSKGIAPTLAPSPFAHSACNSPKGFIKTVRQTVHDLLTKAAA